MALLVFALPALKIRKAGAGKVSSTRACMYAQAN